jgi:hypothetical protein
MADVVLAPWLGPDGASRWPNRTSPFWRHEGTCAECARRFVRTSQATYCSAKCRAKAQDRRHRERVKQASLAVAGEPKP